MYLIWLKLLIPIPMQYLGWAGWVWYFRIYNKMFTYYVFAFPLFLQCTEYLNILKCVTIKSQQVHSHKLLDALNGTSNVWSLKLSQNVKISILQQVIFPVIPVMIFSDICNKVKMYDPKHFFPALCSMTPPPISANIHNIVDQYEYIYDRIL